MNQQGDLLPLLTRCWPPRGLRFEPENAPIAPAVAEIRGSGLNMNVQENCRFRTPDFRRASRRDRRAHVLTVFAASLPRVFRTIRAQDQVRRTVGCEAGAVGAARGFHEWLT